MAAKIETSLLSCAQCSFQTKRSTELTNHTLQTHALAAASRIFESQVSKLMSVDSVVERAGLEPGSLQLMFTDKERKRQHVVQVVSTVTRDQDTLSISDGSHVITNCVAACDTADIARAPKNCIIKINKWSVIQMIPKNETDKSKKKPEYGIKIEEYEMVESSRALPMVGNPKAIQVAVVLDEKTDLHEIVVNLLDNLHVGEAELEAAQKEWCSKMLRILKKTKGMWQCTVCRWDVPKYLHTYKDIC